MIVPDVNLLLYAHVDAYPQHEAALAWWREVLSSDAQVGLAPPVVFGFVRIATNPRVLTPCMSVAQALEVVELWLGCPHVHLLAPGPRHLEIAFALLRAQGAAHNLTTDAQIAAHAIEVQGEVHSHDADFGRFAGLRWRDPLEARRPGRRPRKP